MSETIYANGVVGIPDAVRSLAERLEKIHAVVSIHREANGIHIHIPDPRLLETDGKKELYSRHLAINAELYLGIGRYDVDMFPTAQNRELWEKYRSKGKEVPCAQSHKTDRVYSVKDLLSMSPIEKRGLDLAHVKHRTAAAADGSLNLVDDGTGTKVPAWCGTTVKLSSLPITHPAVVYLADRGFNPFLESSRYGLEYCISAAPQSREKGVFYSRAGNLLNTPEGRIIIPIFVDGHRVGYQCRLIDTVSDGKRFIWQNNKWNEVDEDTGKRLHKYLNAQGSNRNSILFGYDQAVNWSAGKPDKVCVLVEGPLDAIRVGPPAIAVLGSSLSPVQAKLIASKFNRVVIAGDNDEPGRRAVRKMLYMLQDANINPANIDEVIVPTGKDIGGMTYEAAAELLKDKL